jgi:hypothetical protein
MSTEGSLFGRHGHIVVTVLDDAERSGKIADAIHNMSDLSRAWAPEARAGVKATHGNGDTPLATCRDGTVFLPSVYHHALTRGIVALVQVKAEAALRDIVAPSLDEHEGLAFVTSHPRIVCERKYKQRHVSFQNIRYACATKDEDAVQVIGCILNLGDDVLKVYARDPTLSEEMHAQYERNRDLTVDVKHRVSIEVPVGSMLLTHKLSVTIPGGIQDARMTYMHFALTACTHERGMHVLEGLRNEMRKHAKKLDVPDTSWNKKVCKTLTENARDIAPVMSMLASHLAPCFRKDVVARGTKRQKTTTARWAVDVSKGLADKSVEPYVSKEERDAYVWDADTVASVFDVSVIKPFPSE